MTEIPEKLERLTKAELIALIGELATALEEAEGTGQAVSDQTDLTT